ncbi:hypothetical protein [Flammeovirga agarivorans]|uniref:Uncharacterized protein n=1 Tax=Flammeovirga agarivorans TaxID=2726742 RepID=A0A7X8SKK2_9BACT|nr:hypothetical protein [Flammeovirga agarivorans]NLR91944.1 hypothetical protein [Flammeovirga agarivorans]
MRPLLLLTFSLMTFHVLGQAYLIGSPFEKEMKSESSEKNEMTAAVHPAFFNSNDVIEEEGAPAFLGDYIKTFNQAINNKDIQQLSNYFDGAQHLINHEDQLTKYIDNFLCGFEEEKKYNGTKCITLEQVMKSETVSHKLLGDKTLIIKQKLKTKEKKNIMIELVLQLTSTSPKFIGTM